MTKPKKPKKTKTKTKKIPLGRQRFVAVGDKIPISIRSSDCLDAEDCDLAGTLAQAFMEPVAQRLVCTCGSPHCGALFKNEKDYNDNRVVMGNTIANLFAVLIEQENLLGGGAGSVRAAIVKSVEQMKTRMDS